MLIIGEDDFLPHLIKMLSMDKIEVRVCFLPVLKSSGRDRHSVSTEANEMIDREISRSLGANNQPVKCVEFDG